MQKISVITPTLNRSSHLMRCYACFQSQHYQNAEWLIYDDSPLHNDFFARLDEKNIFYTHSPIKRTIGEKRNFLINQASGNLIINFDDDDYYAPTYLSEMSKLMDASQCDLLNLRGFFLYHSILNIFAYWDLNIKTGQHYKMSRTELEMVFFDESNNQGLLDTHLGYGFGWAFKKKIWEKSPYQNIDWNEDGDFALRALRHGFTLNGIMDDKGLCLHHIHGANISVSFPQYILPHNLVYHFFNQL